MKNILFSNANNIETYELYFKNIKEFLSSGQAWRSDIYKKPNTFNILIPNEFFTFSYLSVCELK